LDSTARMRTIAAFVLLVLSTQVHSQSCLVSINGDTYDLTDLTGTQFQASKTMGGSYVYTFTPCQNNCPATGSQMASICQDDSMTGDPVAPVSVFDMTMQWGVSAAPFPTGGIQYSTQNGAPPLCSPSMQPRYATVGFICQSTGPPTFTMLAEPGLNGCNTKPGYVFQLSCPQVCPGYVPPGNGGSSSSASLSGGWIFIIILCVLFPVYFIIGFIYGLKTKGQSGTEACPNIGFWRGLPGLIKDGGSFTVNKIKGCCGKGGSNYDSL